MVKLIQCISNANMKNNCNQNNVQKKYGNDWHATRQINNHLKPDAKLNACTNFGAI